MSLIYCPDGHYPPQVGPKFETLAADMSIAGSLVITFFPASGGLEDFYYTYPEIEESYLMICGCIPLSSA